MGNNQSEIKQMLTQLGSEVLKHHTKGSTRKQIDDEAHTAVHDAIHANFQGTTPPAKKAKVVAAQGVKLGHR